jgi:hypothetical protein
MLSTIINFFLRIFAFFKSNKQAGTIASDVFGKVTGSVQGTIAAFKTVDLGPKERIPQSTLTNPARIYACNVTSHLMMDIVQGAEPISLDSYYAKCLALNAIRPDCYVLDYNKMREASGLKGYKYRSADVTNVNEIIEKLDKGIPMHVHVGGHFEMIRGYTQTPEETLILINDPGYWVDTHMEATTLRVFRFDGNKRIYSKGHDGKDRKALSIGWYEK